MRMRSISEYIAETEAEEAADLPYGPPETWAKSYCKRCELTDKDLEGEPAPCYTMEDNYPIEYGSHQMVEMK